VARLAATGTRVIGVDLHGTEVVADLGTPEGRADAVTGVTAAGGGRLSGLVTCAGLAGDPDATALLDETLQGRTTAVYELCSGSRVAGSGRSNGRSSARRAVGAPALSRSRMVPTKSVYASTEAKSRLPRRTKAWARVDLRMWWAFSATPF